MDITKVLIYVYIVFFIGAGINHFLNPQFYDAIVPQFIPFPRLVHQITGALEIIIPLFLITRFRQDRLDILDEDTLYFIINALNQLDIDYIRNKILLKVLPLKV